MKLKLIFPLVSVGVLSLTSCGQPKDYATHLEDYVYEMEFHNNFNILQLTDIHWSYNTSSSASKTYLDKVFAETNAHLKETLGLGAKIDLVELTGDQFMLANTYHVNTFFDYFDKKADEYDFEYAVIQGNHDRHGLYSPSWFAKRVKQAKHSIYIEEDDNLYGRSNFMIDLKKDNQVVWQIANLDSGASFSETAISPFRDYDYLRKDQTEWWLLQHKRAGENVPGIAYYHIPQQDNGIAWEKHLKGETFKHKFFKLENFADNGNEAYASDFLETAVKNNLKAAFMGHAHSNDWTYETPEGCVVGLGVKTGPELYFAHIDARTEDAAMKEGLESVNIAENFDLIGASLVTIQNIGGSFTLEHLYLNEGTSKDFVRWVKW